MNIRDGYIKRANKMVEDDIQQGIEVEEIVDKAEQTFWEVVLKETGISEPMGMGEELEWRNRITPQLIKFVSDFIRNS